MIKDNFFWFFVLPFFHKEAQNKSRDRDDFLLMMENTCSKKPYTSSHSSRAGRKDFWKAANNKPTH